MKKTGPTNNHTMELIKELKTLSINEQAKIWKRVALDLEKPTRQRRVVNVSRINRFTKEDEVIVVPGKVLGSGKLNHKLVVAAYSFSDSAKKVIETANGRAILIHELLKENPKGKNIKIIG
jgi:large subunit ribosomal protein L18e